MEELTRRPIRTPLRRTPLRTVAYGALVAALLCAVAASATRSVSAQPPADLLPIVSVLDAEHSAHADRLIDGQVGTVDSHSWSNGANRWQPTSYPMRAVVDLGETRRVTGLSFYGGQIPFPDGASLTVATSVSGTPGSFTEPVAAADPTYDAWSTVALADVEARFIELSFGSVEANFNISEIEVLGLVVADDEDDANPIEGVVAVDEQNSESAERLVDDAVGPNPDLSWWNPSIWQAHGYPMTAVLDLGRSYDVDRIDYFVGNLNQGSDDLAFEFSTQVTGNDFVALDRAAGHDWNRWHRRDIEAPAARRIRLRFDSAAARFNLAEVRVFGVEVPPVITTPTPPPTPTPIPDTPTPTPDEPTPTPTPTPTPAGDDGSSFGPQPRSGPPPADIVRAHGFGHWPGDHLSVACRERHDSYWVQGQNADPELPDTHPENLAYHTWHPAIDVAADGTVCDFGHEHGTDPRSAGEAAFELSGGWPAFGYAAAHAAVDHTGNRHEDHVGHKITVATFRAAIGNGANRHDTLYDAGFDCVWLSKIHQGSHSLDAFSNHLHEYYLTLMCDDGSGTPDHSTSFSVKVMYTYGLPNTFVENGCTQDVPWTSGDDTVFDASVLAGPDGESVPAAHRTHPTGNRAPNSRSFTCSSSVIWKDMTEIDEVDLWTEMIGIERPDGDTALTIQPYYVVKNPARIIAAYDGLSVAEGEDQSFELPSQVVRTISLCYDPDTGERLARPLCTDAPAVEPDWRDSSSPFNGTLRAVHFKSSDLRNEGGPATFCTDAFGRAVDDELPCDAGNIEQRMAPFTNHWNDGRFSHGGHSGNIQGSIWSRTPHGAEIRAEPRPDGGYYGFRIGHELVIDNRDPDDNFDGVPDGANIRGAN